MCFAIVATLGFNQSTFIASEEEGSVNVCVSIAGEIERDVVAEVLILQSTASGKHVLYVLIYYRQCSMA